MPAHLLSPNPSTPSTNSHSNSNSHSNQNSTSNNPHSSHQTSRSNGPVDKSLELAPMMNPSYGSPMWDRDSKGGHISPNPSSHNSNGSSSHPHVPKTEHRGSPFPSSSLQNSNQLPSMSSPHLAPIGSPHPHQHLPPISSSAATSQHQSINHGTRLPPLSSSIFPPPPPRAGVSRAELEDYRVELLAGREWLEGMLERTKSKLRTLEDELRGGPPAAGAGGGERTSKPSSNGSNGMVVDGNGAVRLNRPNGVGGERRNEKVWGLENGH
ncbi:hypothetical protein BDY24DRAFT_386286 [Mrakia frigida]|uniref:uncharacterized protein n=1 Tax=Mrakia frigida TaxID=29902 RepID=UPI003FCC1759